MGVEPMQPWTWLYRKNFDEQHRIAARTKPSLILHKYSLPHFTQLLFSWNALRPAQGYFVFSVQVRNATSKKWYDWHTMIIWGATEQRSFAQQREGTSYHHVRLELPHHAVADAVRIKVVPHEGATLDALYSLAFNISRLAHFPALTPEVQRMQSLPVAYVADISKYSQMMLPHAHADRMCSPTATTMLLEYLIKRPIDPLAFALSVYDTGLAAYGSWPFNTAQAFVEAQGAYYFRVTRLNSCVDLYKYIQRGIPVVVSVRGSLAGAFRPYTQGHLLLVAGWDPETQKIWCYDPAAPDHESVGIGYEVKSFLAAWARSHYLAYVAEPNLE